jgi:hypothetical protein
MKNMFVPFLHIEYHKSIMILACPAHEIYKYRLELIVVIFHGQILVYHKHFFGPDSLRFTLWFIRAGMRNNSFFFFFTPIIPHGWLSTGTFLMGPAKRSLVLLAFLHLVLLSSALGLLLISLKGRRVNYIRTTKWHMHHTGDFTAHIFYKSLVRARFKVTSSISHELGV